MKFLKAFDPNLTGPRKQPPDTPSEACEKLRRIRSLASLHVVSVTGEVFRKAIELAERHGIQRQRYFDMQLAATWLVHDIPTLVTENADDFTVITALRLINPFA
jgi:predicted nucleic acid-binding protein